MLLITPIFSLNSKRSFIFGIINHRKLCRCDIIRNTMKKIAILIALLYSTLNLKAQEVKFRDNIDKDSLFTISVQKLPEQMRERYTKAYNEGKDHEKEFLLLMISMPRNSKQELIANYENKKSEILTLKSEYQKLVPKNYIVEIEFEPESKILTTNEEITIKIYKKKGEKKNSGSNEVERNDGFEVVSQNWNLKPNSKELEDVLLSINWTSQTISEIKKLLKDANCISIESGMTTTIGYARSGMGKYFYKVFDEILTSEQKEEYNDGCQYIFYKENIVLEYGGGAIGPQCFERE